MHESSDVGFAADPEGDNRDPERSIVLAVGRAVLLIAGTAVAFLIPGMCSDALIAQQALVNITSTDWKLSVTTSVLPPNPHAPSFGDQIEVSVRGPLAEEVEVGFVRPLGQWFGGTVGTRSFPAAHSVVTGPVLFVDTYSDDLQWSPLRSTSTVTVTWFAADSTAPLTLPDIAASRTRHNDTGMGWQSATGLRTGGLSGRLVMTTERRGLQSSAVVRAELADLIVEQIVSDVVEYAQTSGTVTEVPDSNSGYPLSVVTGGAVQIRCGTRPPETTIGWDGDWFVEATFPYLHSGSCTWTLRVKNTTREMLTLQELIMPDTWPTLEFENPVCQPSEGSTSVPCEDLTLPPRGEVEVVVPMGFAGCHHPGFEGGGSRAEFVMHARVEGTAEPIPVSSHVRAHGLHPSDPDCPDRFPLEATREALVAVLRDHDAVRRQAAGLSWRDIKFRQGLHADRALDSESVKRAESVDPSVDSVAGPPRTTASYALGSWRTAGDQCMAIVRYERDWSSQETYPPMPPLAERFIGVAARCVPAGDVQGVAMWADTEAWEDDFDREVVLVGGILFDPEVRMGRARHPDAAEREPLIGLASRDDDRSIAPVHHLSEVSVDKVGPDGRVTLEFELTTGQAAETLEVPESEWVLP